MEELQQIPEGKKEIVVMNPAQLTSLEAAVAVVATTIRAVMATLQKPPFSTW
jgi:hypothetical protein